MRLRRDHVATLVSCLVKVSMLLGNHPLRNRVGCQGFGRCEHQSKGFPLQEMLFLDALVGSLVDSLGGLIGELIVVFLCFLVCS